MLLYYAISYAKQVLNDFPQYSIIGCRTKCPALIHECRTYNIFYQHPMSDSYFDPCVTYTHMQFVKVWGILVVARASI